MTSVIINTTAVAATVSSAGSVEAKLVSAPVLTTVSGVTDHGGLTGLSGDDHPHYHNDARGDARYPAKVTPATPGRIVRFTGTAGQLGQTSGLFEDASGNVGIGTSSPSHKLSVVGEIDGQLADTLPSSGAGSRLYSVNTSDSPTYGGFNLGGATFNGVNPDGRPNHVMSMGWNIGDNGAPLIASQPAMRVFGAESHYNLNGNPALPGFELHLGSHWKANAVSDEHRPISIYLHKVTHTSELLFNNQIINFSDSTGQNQFLKCTSNGAAPLAGSTWEIFGPTTINLSRNDNVYFRQLNAQGGTYLFLPYIDASNVLRFGQPMWAIGPRTDIGPYPGQHLVLQPTTANDGDSILSGEGPVFTGTHYAFQMEGAPSLDFIGAIYNNRNALTANAIQELRTIGADAGDPFTRYHVFSGGSFDVGIDNSDGDKFKISLGGALGTTDRLVIDSGGNVGIGTAAPSTKLHVAGPIRCASYTVATLPSASAAGAGAQVYVSDESGGAVPTFSDGTNWRRVTDRAVVS